MNAQTKIESAEKPTGLALLRVPFPPHQISQLPKGNLMLDYVGHAALTDRLLDADPNWTWEPVAFGPDGLPAFDQIGGLWIRLTVCGHTRLGYGHPDNKKGGNAIKEAIGDALRNAAMRFGAALDLWHKGDLHADDEAPEQEPIKQVQSNGMPDAEWARLVQLVEATKSDTNAMCKHYGVKALRDLDQDKYDACIEALNKKLAKMVKGETDAKAAQQSSKVLDDEIPY